jgi:N-acetylglucosamine kinase-like BadF-type ATPase
MSGGPEDKRAILERIVRADRWVITHDAAIALSGATASGNGILVISGTGSMAWGRNAKGESARAGGWGYVFGDEGSAFDIVRQAVRAALRMEEGWGLRPRCARFFFKRRARATPTTRSTGSTRTSGRVRE